MAGDLKENNANKFDLNRPQGEGFDNSGADSLNQARKEYGAEYTDNIDTSHTVDNPLNTIPNKDVVNPNQAQDNALPVSETSQESEADPSQVEQQKRETLNELLTKEGDFDPSEVTDVVTMGATPACSSPSHVEIRPDLQSAHDYNRGSHLHRTGSDPAAGGTSEESQVHVHRPRPMGHGLPLRDLHLRGDDRGSRNDQRRSLWPGRKQGEAHRRFYGLL